MGGAGLFPKGFELPAFQNLSVFGVMISTYIYRVCFLIRVSIKKNMGLVFPLFTQESFGQYIFLCNFIVLFID